MGNDNQKNSNSRGKPLGNNVGQPLGSKTNTQQRKNLVQTKRVHQSELDRKQKIVDILDGKQQEPNFEKNRQNRKLNTNYNKTKNTSNDNKSIFMSDPYKKEAIAAQNRLKMKTKKTKQESIQSRREKTRDLLFNNGLNKDIQFENTNNNTTNNNINKKKKKQHEDEYFKNSSKSSEAALKRFDNLSKQKNNKMSKQDRKDRTIQLLHGDLLSNDNNNNNNSTKTNETIILLSLEELLNSNSDDQILKCAKILSKIISNLLKASTKEQQDKYGNIRLTNKKINETIVSTNGGVECLLSLGFYKYS